MSALHNLTYRAFQRYWRCGAGGVFLLALATYWLTMEPSGSYWDCGEYVASAVCLETGHPPGNPVYWLAGRMAANFSPSHAALCINALSGLFSALTVLLLFLTLRIMSCRLMHIVPDKAVPSYKALTVIGVSTSGALLFAWSDTFWFSAVEAEVYAFASLFTALMFWLMLVWYERADEPHSERILILIAYLSGLSIGVHLLVLLCLPALTLIWAYRRYPQMKVGGALLAAFGGMVAIAAILYGIVPGTLRLTGWLELMAVNDLGLPFHSGIMLGLLLIIIFFAAILIIIYRQKNYSLFLRRLSVLVWSGAAVIVGLTSYGIVLIRANAAPPMNQGEPADIFALRAYMERDQYGSSPLLYGNTPNSHILLDKSTRHYARRVKATKYTRKTEGGKSIYVPKGYTYEYLYQPETKTFMPRIHSSGHKDGYADWVGMTDSTMKRLKASVYIDSAGQLSGSTEVLVPTAAQHAGFMLGYQTGYMYLRYLLWNFSGRQNDRPSQGQADAGNFITGISPIDDAMLGPQDCLPKNIGQDNPGHNVYYMLPLLLGIAGMIWQYRCGRRGRRQFNITLTLFIMTGLAIVIYLNQTPNEPRERDYAFVGSFYAFALWCGLGVGAIAKVASRIIRYRTDNAVFSLLPPVLASALGLGIATLVLWQNEDDHNRSGRTAMPDFAYNTLQSVRKNGIIFTDGDNYTFPLWYLQEVEGVRPDIRIINTTYLSADWYGPQMKRASRESAPLLMTASEDVIKDKRFHSVLLTSSRDTINAVAALKALYSDTSENPRLHGGYLQLGPGAGNVVIDASRDLAGGKAFVGLRPLIIFDIVATNASLPAKQRRPIHWIPRSQVADMIGLAPMTVREGAALRLDTIRHGDQPMDVATTLNLVNRTFRWGGAPEGSNTYIDPTSAPMMEEARRMLLQLASELTDRQRYSEAIGVLSLMEHEMPYSSLAPGVSAKDYIISDEGVETGKLYCRIGKATNNNRLVEKGLQMIGDRVDALAEYVRYFRHLNARELHAQTIRSLNSRKAYGGAAQAWFDCGGGKDKLLRRKGAKGIDVDAELKSWQRGLVLRTLLKNARLQAKASQLSRKQYGTLSTAERKADTIACRKYGEWLHIGATRSELEKYAEMADFDYERAEKIAGLR